MGRRKKKIRSLMKKKQKLPTMENISQKRIIGIKKRYHLKQIKVKKLSSSTERI
jgi:hypothetical protein